MAGLEGIDPPTRGFGGYLQRVSAADPEHDPAEDVPPLEPRVRLRRLRKRIDRRDRHAEPRLGYGALQPCEFVRTGHRVICAQANPAAAAELGLDAVGVHHPPTGTHEIEAPLECLATREGKGSIDPVRCERVEPFRGVVAPGVDDGVGAESPNERGCAAAPDRRQHTRPPSLRELYRKRPHRTGCPED